MAISEPAMTKAIQVAKLMLLREVGKEGGYNGASARVRMNRSAARGQGSAYFFFGLMAAFSVAPAAKRGVFDAAILMTSPVAGLRPLRAARLVTEKVPKPVIPTVSPFFRRSVM